jgi:hypothetical protein
LQEKQLYVEFDQIKGWVSKVIGPPSLMPKFSTFQAKQKKEDNPELRQVRLYDPFMAIQQGFSEKLCCK